MTTISGSAQPAIAPPFRGHRWGWLLALGLAQIVLGSIALCFPVSASFAAVAVYGAVLLMGAIFQLVHAFMVRSWPHSVWYGLGGVLYAIAGVFVILYPIRGALSLALTLAVLFVADGALRIAFSIANRKVAGSGWILAAGVSSMAVGIIFLVGWPASALWTTGVLLGINLLLIGCTQAALAVGTR
jgi:uncharacterized membrane protein HdeD (DUF308 family)